ncbi:ATP18 [Brettanomyces bruxellensis]|uniref:DEBR0S4_03312g1_1 n=1 Tax=Dekkera bruxellensis TaxID=5007 RepID=A0A3F2Y9N1_DEKBR|nr:uncharacterized protein BRETT_005206 [Brettanomyces bruxellensis]QOU18146.1 hypothetical protein BRETT_005206 [Brettanomyces bruxellensis]VUG18825.1 ATP18 [Brettanomyces bruxellensis]
MKFLGSKVYRYPVFKTYWPFFVGAVATYYLIGKAQSAMENSEQYINDPRHPRFRRGEKDQK